MNSCIKITFYYLGCFYLGLVYTGSHSGEPMFPAPAPEPARFTCIRFLRSINLKSAMVDVLARVRGPSWLTWLGPLCAIRN